MSTRSKTVGKIIYYLLQVRESNKSLLVRGRLRWHILFNLCSLLLTERTSIEERGTRTSNARLLFASALAPTSRLLLGVLILALVLNAFG